jgi:hypothetical protein
MSKTTINLKNNAHTASVTLTYTDPFNVDDVHYAGHPAALGPYAQVFRESARGVGYMIGRPSHKNIERHINAAQAAAATLRGQGYSCEIIDPPDFSDHIPKDAQDPDIIY